MTMTSPVRYLAALYALALLGGCASVAGGNVQKMYVQTAAQDGQQVLGAECALSNDRGSWMLRSPGDTTVVRSNKPIEVKCNKASMPQGVATVESATRGAMFGNILIGGVVGAAIDHSSGAAYEYPSVIRVVMGQILSFGGPTMPAMAADTRAPAASAAVGQQASRSAAEATPPPLPGYLAVPVAASARPKVIKMHARAVPASSGYADINNADAVPVRAEGKDRYLHYLTLASPKAFVIYESGGWRFAYDSPEAMSTVLDTCAREGRKCWLYAVDDKVVWREDVTQRISRTDQLGQN